MDHPTHSTGLVWMMIFKRIIVGMVFYQVAMIGYLSLNKAYTLSLFLAPLPFVTVLILGYNIEKSYSPTLRYIALRSLRDNKMRPRSNSRTVDEERENELEYINPNLISGLEPVWKPSGIMESQA